MGSLRGPGVSLRRRAQFAPAKAGGSLATLLSHTSAAYTGATTGATTSAINTTGATIIIIAVSSFESGTDQTAPIDSLANTWTQMTLYQSTNTGVRLYYCKGPATGPAHTFEIHVTANAFASCAVAAFSSTSTSGGNDINIGANNSIGSHSVQPGSATPAHNNELIVTALNPGDAAATVSVDSGFTITDQVLFLSGQHFGVALAYLAQSTAASENPTWTLPGVSSTYDANVTMASFQ